MFVFLNILQYSDKSVIKKEYTLYSYTYRIIQTLALIKIESA